MTKMNLQVLDLNTGSTLCVEFPEQDIAKTMLSTSMLYPLDYPVEKFNINGKDHLVRLVGYKSSTGNSVYIMANGTLITQEFKRVKDPLDVVWRLRLERD